jgi:hypothetical protein
MYRGCLPIDAVKKTNGSSAQISSRTVGALGRTRPRSHISAGGTAHASKGVHGSMPPATIGT